MIKIQKIIIMNLEYNMYEGHTPTSDDSIRVCLQSIMEANFGILVADHFKSYSQRAGKLSICEQCHINKEKKTLRK